jgi:hypothetical protein
MTWTRRRLRWLATAIFLVGIVVAFSIVPLELWYSANISTAALFLILFAGCVISGWGVGVWMRSNNADDRSSRRDE